MLLGRDESFRADNNVKTHPQTGLLAMLLVAFIVAFLLRPKKAKASAAVHGDVTEGDGFTVTVVDPSKELYGPGY